MKNPALIGLVVLLLVSVGGVGLFLARKSSGGSTATEIPVPTEEPVAQLNPEQYPKVSLTFSKDAHYVTVNISNLYADQLEYNLIYEALVKKEQGRIQTGVSAGANLEGKNTYSKEQLLGSESSGKFSYHQDIKGAMLELTLRDASNRSIYKASYPFEVAAGKTVELAASE